MDVPYDALVVCDYSAEDECELQINVGMVVEILEVTEEGWSLARLGDLEGWVPSDYVAPVGGEEASPHMTYGRMSNVSPYASPEHSPVASPRNLPPTTDEPPPPPPDDDDDDDDDASALQQLSIREEKKKSKKKKKSRKKDKDRGRDTGADKGGLSSAMRGTRAGGAHGRQVSFGDATTAPAYTNDSPSEPELPPPPPSTSSSRREPNLPAPTPVSAYSTGRGGGRSDSGGSSGARAVTATARTARAGTSDRKSKHAANSGRGGGASPRAAASSPRAAASSPRAAASSPRATAAAGAGTPNGPIRPCAQCGKHVWSGLSAKGKLFHADCFKCFACSVSLRGKGFLEREGKFYCEKDYYQQFNPRCAGCDGIIMDQCLNALAKKWHPNCFKCHQCSSPLQGYVNLGGKALCVACANSG